MTNKIGTSLANADLFLGPRIVYVVTTVNRRGKTNAAPFSYITPVSTEPAALALAICPEWTTFINIRSVRQFVVNVPSLKLLEKVWICGDKYSGNLIPTELNKIAVAGFTEIPSSIVLPPRLAECYAHLECQVEWIRRVGDHMLVLAEILAASHDEEIYKSDALLDIERFKPIMQVIGRHFTIPDGDILVDDERVRLVVQSRTTNTGIRDSDEGSAAATSSANEAYLL